MLLRALDAKRLAQVGQPQILKRRLARPEPHEVVVGAGQPLRIAEGSMAEKPSEFGNLRRDEGSVEVHVLPEGVNLLDVLLFQPQEQSGEELVVLVALVQVEAVDFHCLRAGVLRPPCPDSRHERRDVRPWFELAVKRQNGDFDDVVVEWGKPVVSMSIAAMISLICVPLLRTYCSTISIVLEMIDSYFSMRPLTSHKSITPVPK